jgi:hypothetical protein
MKYHTHTHTHTNTQTKLCVGKCTHIRYTLHIYTQTLISYIHTQRHSQTYVDIQTHCTYIDMHKDTQTHTSSCPDIHRHTCTCTHIYQHRYTRETYRHKHTHTEKKCRFIHTDTLTDMHRRERL